MKKQGSIPFSYIITKKFFNKDITHFYDKNPGATNAFRTSRNKKSKPSLSWEIACFKLQFFRQL
ncbi:glycerol-3-phosphate acyltransferase [Caldicellulosiruptor acetigenus]|uniref:glycerol-3-phosphate acyltransferase n=1 Tax=Caldicellulosiruptor acetigenus TaxID=301953 RepID=UPI000A0402F1|nr:glycerol-3-phosphate acyltransferase [Caldicellulosiruptor acetigenus]WAM37507.1 glycerol-3-phosphate acyltransferase [Caldicellulosiruptor acetigenus]